MRLKSFHADTMTEAMAQVRATLGEDAIIISTREDKDKQTVRVTAAIEDFEQEPVLDFGEDAWLYGDEEASDPIPDNENHLFRSIKVSEEKEHNFDDAHIKSQRSEKSSTAERPKRSLTEDHQNIIDYEEEDYLSDLFSIRDNHLEENDNLLNFFDFELDENEEGQLIEGGSIENITEALLRHNVPASIADRIISEVISSEEDSPSKALIHSLDKIYSFKSLPSKKHANPLMLVGPPGSGKTLTIAKLAAKAVLNDLSVTVITTDTIRAGGIEQLEAFTRVLDINLITADDPYALEQAIQLHHKADQILIDTAGVSPFNPAEMKTLSSFIKVADFDTVLVLPAGGDASESADIARSFEILGTGFLMPTRFDISRRYGGILAAADLAHLAFVGGSKTPLVSEGLFSLEASSLAKILVPDLYK